MMQNAIRSGYLNRIQKLGLPTARSLSSNPPCQVASFSIAEAKVDEMAKQFFSLPNQQRQILENVLEERHLQLIGRLAEIDSLQIRLEKELVGVHSFIFNVHFMKGITKVWQRALQMSVAKEPAAKRAAYLNEHHDSLCFLSLLTEKSETYAYLMSHSFAEHKYCDKEIVILKKPIRSKKVELPTQELFQDFCSSSVPLLLKSNELVVVNSKRTFYQIGHLKE